MPLPMLTSGRGTYRLRCSPPCTACCRTWIFFSIISGDSFPVSCVVMWQEPQGPSHPESQALQQYFMRSVHGFWAARMASFPITSFPFLFGRESPHSPWPLVMSPLPPGASPRELPNTSFCRDRTSYRAFPKGRKWKTPRSVAPRTRRGAPCLNSSSRPPTRLPRTTMACLLYTSDACRRAI